MPELRAPSDRSAAWANYHARMAGGGTPPTSMPECGFYKAKRKGQFVGVQIDLIQITDDDGALIEPEKFVAFIKSDTFYGERVDEIWLRCAGNPITEAEFERLHAAPTVSDLSREFVV